MTETVQRKPLSSWLCIVIYIIGFIAISGILTILTSLILGIFSSHIHHSGTEIDNFVAESCMLIAILITTSVMLRLGERKRMNVIGLKYSGQNGSVILGFIVATLIIGGGFYLLLKMGEIRITKIHFFGRATLIYNIIFFIIVAIAEEVSFRGYILGRLLRTKLNKLVALCISAALFMLMHGANDHITFIPIVNLFLAGLLLGSVYIYTKNLWYSISLHFFWNFLQGPIFGFSVSGTDTSSIFRIKTSADTLINGGSFGFEGSLICTFLCALTIIITLLIMNNCHRENSIAESTIE